MPLHDHDTLVSLLMFVCFSASLGGKIVLPAISRIRVCGVQRHSRLLKTFPVFLYRWHCYVRPGILNFNNISILL